MPRERMALEKNLTLQYELPIECMPVKKNLAYRRRRRCLGGDRTISIQTIGTVKALATETKEQIPKPRCHMGR